MPLLDHFQAPLYPRHAWESFHSVWAASIMGRLNSVLPSRYFAACQIHLGRHVEADVAEFDSAFVEAPGNGAAGGVAVATWAPPVATHTMPAIFPDDIEVQVMDTRDGAVLVAVVELVSPANKDRDDARAAFADKCAAYLRRGIGVVVVDIVTTRRANRHNQLIARMNQPNDFQMTDDVLLYTSAYGPTRRNDKNQIEIWLQSLEVDKELPTMPLVIRGGGCVPLELEQTYTQARQMSRL